MSTEQLDDNVAEKAEGLLMRLPEDRRPSGSNSDIRRTVEFAPTSNVNGSTTLVDFGDAEGAAGDDAMPPDEDSEETTSFFMDDFPAGKPLRKESRAQFAQRHARNLLHFFVEDWFISAMLGILTAIFSIGIDVAIEYLNHFRIELYNSAKAVNEYMAFGSWLSYVTLLTGLGSFICFAFGRQAVGSGIPEVKVIIHGFTLHNYLTLRTLFVKMITLTLVIGAGIPVGKEGPFVHIGAIVASILSKATATCRFNAFFSNEGRAMEMLSIGCAVGIACTFSAPAGAVLYGIESTSKYFAVKNYWRSFFATTCSAMIFRFAMNFIVPHDIAGTITAYYQTNFPNEVFVVEEIPIFILCGVIFGLLGALFIWFHRQVALFKKKNRAFVAMFGKRPVVFTILAAIFIAMMSFPDGLGKFFAGHLTFRETLSDFIANCTFLSNTTGCSSHIVSHWTMGFENPLWALAIYFAFYFVVVAISITLYIPSGIFVPCFVMGASGGRLIGELLALWFPEGIRGLGGPQIYPGLYAVVGAAAYTGSVTHSLSIALIVCETTGQLCALLPVLIALMIANAICSFLQPSIYESTIKIQNYPYLADLPPSRVSVHTMKVDQIMLRDIVFITRETTYRELREILLETPNLRSYPFIADRKTMILLGSVSRKYLLYILTRKLGPEPGLNISRRRSKTASEIMNTINNLRRNSSMNANALSTMFNQDVLTDRHISGTTLLAHSPLHDEIGANSGVETLLRQQNSMHEPIVHSLAKRAEIMASKIDMDDLAIDPAPFQLVKGTSLYKVHTLFSLLALNHAYVTDRGRLVGVVALKELREAFAHIYTKGVLMPHHRSVSVSMRLYTDPEENSNSYEANGNGPRIQIDPPSNKDANEKSE